MRSLIRTVALWSFLVWPCAGRAEEKKPVPPPLAITHVTVIDATGAPARADMTVVVTGDRITALGKTGTVPLPDGARVEDATGKFLIPGLWDMHTHVLGKEMLALFVANGVTGVREMANFPLVVFTLRDQVAAGTLLGPRMVAAGLIVDGPNPAWPFSIPVANEKEGREAVQTLKKRGSDFIKVYSLLPRDAYLAVADEAKKQGLPFAGHVPLAVSVAEASDAGQKSVEHLSGVLLACSKQQDELRKEFLEARSKQEEPTARLLGLRAQAKSLDSYDEKLAAALFARFVRNGTWHCPTLTVLRAFAHQDDRKFTDDARLRYVAPLVKGYLYPKGPGGTAEEFAVRRQLYRKYLELVGGLHRAKVDLLAGTDSPNPYCFPGFSLHDELELLVSAGLTPMEALQCATRNPARYLGRLKDLGTVEEGKLADLVLLEGDPLADVKNTRKIAAVVVNGRWLAKDALAKMLAEVEEGYKK